MPKIVINTNTNTLSPIGITMGRKYDFETIETCIKLNEPVQIFMMLTDANGLLEVVELVKVSESTSEQIYKVKFAQPLRITGPVTKIKYLIYNPDNHTYAMTNEYQMLISIEHY